ncbi:hypothetical protein G9P44_000785 [Scheffersomyces stipitis]|nr:hypothetical protein G9P44_000785 [Scheffersomyces stipitis]
MNFMNRVVLNAFVSLAFLMAVSAADGTSNIPLLTVNREFNQSPTFNYENLKDSLDNLKSFLPLRGNNTRISEFKNMLNKLLSDNEDDEVSLSESSTASAETTIKTTNTVSESIKTTSEEVYSGERSETTSSSLEGVPDKTSEAVVVTTVKTTESSSKSSIISKVTHKVPIQTLEGRIPFNPISKELTSSPTNFSRNIVTKTITRFVTIDQIEMNEVTPLSDVSSTFSVDISPTIIISSPPPVSWRDEVTTSPHQVTTTETYIPRGHLQRIERIVEDLRDGLDRQKKESNFVGELISYLNRKGVQAPATEIIRSANSYSSATESSMTTSSSKDISTSSISIVSSSFSTSPSPQASHGLSVKELLNQKLSNKVDIIPQFQFHDHEVPKNYAPYAKPKSTWNSISSEVKNETPRVSTIAPEPTLDLGADILDYLERKFPDIVTSQLEYKSKSTSESLLVSITKGSIPSSQTSLAETFVSTLEPHLLAVSEVEALATDDPKHSNPDNVRHVPKDISVEKNAFGTLSNKDLTSSYLLEQVNGKVQVSEVEADTSLAVDLINAPAGRARSHRHRSGRRTRHRNNTSIVDLANGAQRAVFALSTALAAVSLAAIVVFWN